MSTVIAYWNILRKDIENYYLKPPNISWGIIFPLSWTLMQLIRSSGNIEIIELLPGLMAMSILFGTTSMLAVTITFEKRGRSFERLLIAPISIGTLVWAKISAALVFGIINAFVPLLLAALLTTLEGINWIMVFMATLLIAITSTMLGLMIAVSAKEVFEAQTMSNFFRFPMLFLCGLFIPLSQLPTVLRPISYLLPLTYGTDLLNGAIRGSSMLNIYIDILMLIFFAILLFYICHRNINRKWIR